MKIGIDAREVMSGGGNATYTYNLIRNLIKIDPEIHYDLFTFLHDMGRRSVLDYSTQNSHEIHAYLTNALIPFANTDKLNDSLIPLIASLRGTDIFHFTNPLNVTKGKFKTIVTIHDLASERHPEWVKASSRAIIDRKIGLIKSADAFIAVSEYTKKDMVNRLGIAPEKIRVIYEAASEAFFPDPEREAVAPFTSGQPYVLCVGQLQPRKNLSRLIEAFALIASRFPKHSLILVGVGRDKEYTQMLHGLVEQYGLQGRIIFASRVDNTTLRKLYSCADCSAYVSLFEGFGLPILESLQCGTPVVASNTTSLPEVLGDAGLLVDPENKDEIARMLEKMLSENELRQHLSKKAIDQAAHFSWHKTALETLGVYASLQ